MFSSNSNSSGSSSVSSEFSTSGRISSELLFSGSIVISLSIVDFSVLSFSSIVLSSKTSSFLESEFSLLLLLIISFSSSSWIISSLIEILVSFVEVTGISTKFSSNSVFTKMLLSVEGVVTLAIESNFTSTSGTALSIGFSILLILSRVAGTISW